MERTLSGFKLLRNRQFSGLYGADLEPPFATTIKPALNTKITFFIIYNFRERHFYF